MNNKLNQVLEIVTIYLSIEVLLMMLTGRIFLLVSALLFFINKNTLRSGVVCRILSMYDWQYFTVRYNIDFKHIKEIEMLHRKCKVSEREEREKLPRCKGYSTFKILKQ